nr:MAG TPA: hypothetical protein [Siphoviridae sp. ctV7v5]
MLILSAIFSSFTQISLTASQWYSCILHISMLPDNLFKSCIHISLYD